MDLIAIVLAAGKGTGMHSSVPKVMHPMAGRPMLCYGIDAVRALEPVELVTVVGQGSESVCADAGSGIIWVTQDAPLGTAHAVQQAATAAAGRAGAILVLHGDLPLIRPETLRTLVGRHIAESATVTCLTRHAQDPTRAVHGVLCFSDAWLWSALAQLQQFHSSQSAAGVGGELDITALVAVASAHGEPVAAVTMADPMEVIDVDDRLQLARAEVEVRRRINERWMLAGVTLVHPETTYIDATVELCADSVIWPNSLILGQTRIGQGCTIGPGAMVRDSIISDHCLVQYSVVENAFMDEGSNVGPYGHLRSGARLGAGVHMGNFGEVKNSTLGPGVKMGHFSYLGDAVVGAGTNIGAGTITCNFDGERKHRTLIGQGAFIGSDTMLVAPVEIGEGARTGAGSVVTRDVPAGSVVYGVPARAHSSAHSEQPEGEERDNE